MNPQNKIITLFVLLTLLHSTYQECKEGSDQFLVTFHPHLDAFWLNTHDQLRSINFRPAGFLYAMNQRNSKTIFNSMLKALLQSPNRKYFVTEVVFFKDWYDYLGSDEKSKVADLLKNGQLEIGNAGWVENDEAVCYYDDVLDQYTIGMNFLHQQLDYHTRVGWATDSFGHSHSQVALQHILGIEFQGIQRIDDRYLYQHKNGPLLQFYWQAVSDSNNKTYGGVLNQIRHFLHEVNNLRGQRGSSIKSDFEKVTETMRTMYKKNKFFRFLGNDFEQFVSEQFEVLENGMKQMNNGENQCPMYKYGNPTDYLNLITTYYEKNKLPTRKYDFMPNWDQDRYWSGYYTSDPQLKKNCKDFSRLINLFRKLLLKSFPQTKVPPILKEAEQVLAILQHHDGITATSKLHIENEYKGKMSKISQQIFKQIFKIYNVAAEGQQIVCKMHENNNMCEITDNRAETLFIITQGNVKKQKIEIKLPPNTYYSVGDVEFDIFCENQNQNCKLVFEAVLYAGTNEFSLKVARRDEIQSKVHVYEKIGEYTFSGRDYHISLNPTEGEIKYQFNDGEYIEYSFHTSINSPSSRQTMSWNKYGNKTVKTERVVPGIYIMSNSGKLDKLPQSFKEMKAVQGSLFIKVLIKSEVITIQMTIKNDEPNIADVVLDFKPPSRSMVDYFVKMSSTVKSESMYHDSNGYLVSKRQKNKRPDYDWQAKKEDLINANNYPVCSFAYMIENNKKFLLSIDRALGVAIYENSLLLNIDRLDMDDGKGVGEGYSVQMQNKFHFKTAIISEKDNIERLWQRSYDEATIGYITKSLNGPDKIHKNNYYESHKNKHLKYSIFYLNEEEIVLRLHNLAQNENIELVKYRAEDDGFTFSIEEVGLSLKFKGIKESFANGLIKTEYERKHWGGTDEINTKNAGSNDRDGVLIIRPLQIRSFRINFSKVIESEEPKPTMTTSKQDLTVVNIQHSKTVQPITPRKRCF